MVTQFVTLCALIKWSGEFEKTFLEAWGACLFMKEKAAILVKKVFNKGEWLYMRPIECNGYHECAVRLAKAALFFVAMPLAFAACVGEIFGNKSLAEEIRKLGWKPTF